MQGALRPLMFPWLLLLRLHEHLENPPHVYIPPTSIPISGGLFVHGKYISENKLFQTPKWASPSFLNIQQTFIFSAAAYLRLSHCENNYNVKMLSSGKSWGSSKGHRKRLRFVKKSCHF